MRPFLFAAALWTSACASDFTPASSGAIGATATSSASVTPAATSPVPAGGVRFAVASKSAASVRVQEHLAANLVNTDAVLTSDGIDGTITITADGSFTADSKIVVDMTKLHSDQAFRDRWLSLFGIETAKFKTSTFVPERAIGLPAPLPATGSWTFTLEGTLTVHGVSKAVSWNATADRNGGALTGTASTTVRWSDFGLEKPQGAVTQVVTVSDDIRLEITFAGSQTN